jgi:hypothetical protein
MEHGPDDLAGPAGHRGPIPPIGQRLDQRDPAPAFLVRPRSPGNGRVLDAVPDLNQDTGVVAGQPQVHDRQDGTVVRRPAVRTGASPDRIGEQFADHEPGRVGRHGQAPLVKHDPGKHASARHRGRQRAKRQVGRERPAGYVLRPGRADDPPGELMMRGAARRDAGAAGGDRSGTHWSAGPPLGAHHHDPPGRPHDVGGWPASRHRPGAARGAYSAPPASRRARARLPRVATVSG